MSKQPATIDQFSENLASEAARPPAFRAKLASIDGTAAATLERFDANPLESDIDQVLTAQSVKLATTAALESFDRFTMENRQQALADAAAATNKTAGKTLLEAGLAERCKNRAARMADLGRQTAAVTEEQFKPDLSDAEYKSLEVRRAALVATAEGLDSFVPAARNAITYFSNTPSAETWQDAVRAVRAVDFS